MSDPLVIEKGVIAGNVTDKYGASNPVYRALMRRFCSTVLTLTDQTKATDIHEVGCGEGHLTRLLARSDRTLRASDFSERIIARARALDEGNDRDISYAIRSIYDLEEVDAAQLIVCCEVLEHLDDPDRALEILAGLARPYLLASVPREPLWRVLNVLRGKYLTQAGNTPGHLNHWSSGSFIRFLQRRFEIVRVEQPLPWTVVLCRVNP